MSLTEGLLILVAVNAYFIPAWIASVLRSPRGAEVLMMNLMLGWTGVGWFIALIWAIRPPASGNRGVPRSPPT